MLIKRVAGIGSIKFSPHPKSLSQGERDFEFPPLPLGEGARG